MHEMQTIVIDDRGALRSSAQLHGAKMAEQIKMLFRVNRGGSRNFGKGAR